MVKNVIMPHITMTMIEGMIGKWLKKIGDSVNENEPLLEVETDKVTETLNSPYRGVLLEIRANEGDIVPVESIICTIGEQGELGADSIKKQGREEFSRLSEGELSNAVENQTSNVSKKILASPLAKRIASEIGIDLNTVSGTGVRHMITKTDVVTKKEVLDVKEKEVSEESCDQDIHIPFIGLRRRIADNLMRTKLTMADVTTFAEVNLNRIKKLRENFKVSYTTFAVRAAALALEEFPMINAQIIDEDIVVKKQINVNVAVSTERGLVTPVLKDVNKKNILSIAEEIDDLACRGRENKLTAADMVGGTFTVTNSGVYGAMFFTPIINSPQSAILGMGKIFTLALFNDEGQIEPTTMLILSLSYDHRIVDGETAVKFLQRTKRYMENPIELTEFKRVNPS